MTRFTRNNRTSAFTLIELLVVIAILAILATVIVVVINPGELLKQSRDTDRLADLASINKALGLLLVDQPSASLGRSNTVYVSLPDATLSGTATSTCASLGLPTLPSPYTYECHSPQNYRKVDGTGWIPVNLTQFSTGAILSTLPVDPSNASSSFLYYTYMTNSSNWKLTSDIESRKYETKKSNDGGIQSGLFEIGSDVSMIPADGTNCTKIKENFPSSPSGLYWIKPNAFPAVQVFCDMVNDGGGWTLVLNNGPFTPQPAPNWIQATTQNTVTGSISTNFSTFDQLLGLGYWNDIGTQMKLEQGASSASLSHKAIYTFTIDKYNTYKLTLTNENILLTTIGTASPGLYSYNQNYKFTTYDSDNDNYGSNCSNSYGNTAWWYGSCWSGSFWGYNSTPYWSGAGSATPESFSWGGIWLK